MKSRYVKASMSKNVFLGLVLLLLFANIAASPSTSDFSQKSFQFKSLLHKAQTDGSVRIFVEVKLPEPFQPEGNLHNDAARNHQRENIRKAQKVVLDALSTTKAKIKARYDVIPSLALDVDEQALQSLARLPIVGSIHEREPHYALLNSSVPWIKGDIAHKASVDGSGYTVAIIDSGIDSSLATFQDAYGQPRVVSEACFSDSNLLDRQTLCPNGSTSQIGTGSASALTSACLSTTGDEVYGNLCFHGTHVAGIAAGRDSTYTGVAPKANIIAIQVFYRENWSCGDLPTPCVMADPADEIAALNRVYALRTIYNIAAVNMSLGGGAYSSACDTSQSDLYNAVSNLVSSGIAVIAASGNDGYTTQMLSPACLSNVVSVAATNEHDDGVYSKNDTASMLDLFAPGVNIWSFVPTNSTYPRVGATGTSMAAPHVTGAWALMKQLMPGATYAQIFNAVTSNGPTVTQNGFTRHRVDVLASGYALAPVSPDLVSVSIGASSVTVGESFSVIITAKNNQGFSEEGAINSSVLFSNSTHNLSISNVSASWNNSLINYAPGQGPIYNNNCQSMGNAVDHLIEATDTAWGPNETHTLAFAVTPNQAGTVLVRVRTTMKAGSGCNYHNDTSASGGTTDTDQQGWTVLRLTVSALNPVPSLSMISPTVATAGGGGFTLTVNGSNFISSSKVRWNGSDRTTTYVNGNQLTASIPASDIASAGTAYVTVYNPTPGGGTSGQVPFAITANNPVPSLSMISPTAGTAGGGGFTLTVNGSNFISSSKVRWNGSDRTTTYVNGNQLTASIPASDIISAGTAYVTVYNPTPGGGTSGQVPFNINTVNSPEINLQGNSISIASGDATPAINDGTDFGTINISDGTISRSFTILNTGNADLILSGNPKVVISGANASDFTVSQQPTSPISGPSGSTTVTVIFDPSVAGLRAATISIVNNDANENPYMFAVQGTGTSSPSTCGSLLFTDDFSTSKNWTDQTGGYVYRDTTNQWLNWTAARNHPMQYYIPINAASDCVQLDFRFNVTGSSGNGSVYFGLAENLTAPLNVWGVDVTGAFTGLNNDGVYPHRMIFVANYANSTYDTVGNPDTTVNYGALSVWRRGTLKIDHGTWTMIARADDGTLLGQMSGAMSSQHVSYKYIMMVFDVGSGGETEAGCLDDVSVYGVSTSVSQTFADVPTDYWAWSYIERLYNAGITSGCGGGNFCPTNTVTRDQMAVFLLKGKHGSGYVPPAPTGEFSDVPMNYWAASWIEQLAMEGITAGCGGGKYCPTTAVTRDQMAVFLLKAKHGSGYVPPAATGLFSDVPTNYWAAAWIEQLAREGVTAGCGGGKYCPTIPVTRDQMAVFLVKNFNLP